MACSICSNLSPETLNHIKPGQLATIFIEEYELAASALSGDCPECKLLFDAISLKKKHWAPNKEQSLSILVNVAVGKPVQINCNKAGIFLNIFHVDNGIGSKNVQEVPGIIGNASLIPRNSGSEKCLSVLQSWFLDCKSSHGLCQLQREQSVLPKRLIDVGSRLPSTADTLLVEMTEAKRVEYMALSYCWGDPTVHQVLKTVGSNVDQFKKRIVFKALTLTLQHAVILARRLGLRYVWIDALCIVQDDADDWLKEASKMCDVYSGATLTVVACRADGSSGGIFGVQKYSACTQIPYRNAFVNVSEDYERDHAYNILLHESSDLDPVHTRAWTFQEAILSNRAIFFTSQELRWECNTGRHCQCGKLSKRYPTTLDQEEVHYELYRTWRLDDFFPAASIEEAYLQWSMMYSFFTARALTNDGDRLAALSGLARRFAKIMKFKFGRDERYLAGIWLGSLPRDLLWQIEFKGLSKVANRRHERPKNWRAPSWSWASMEADAARYRFGDLQSLVHVMDASTDLAGPDPFGQVKKGPLNYLRIDGPMLRGISFNYDVAAAGALQRNFPTVSYRGSNLRQAIITIDDDMGEETDRYINDASQEFSILVVGYSPGGDTHESLILRPVVGEEETLERLGMTRLGPHFREPAKHKAIIEEAPRYTITLV